MREGGEDLVEFLVALQLAALGTAAAPQQTHLELRLEDLKDVGLYLEPCDGGRRRGRGVRLTLHVQVTSYGFAGQDLQGLLCGMKLVRAWVR